MVNDPDLTSELVGIQAPGDDFARENLSATCLRSSDDQFCSTIPQTVLMDVFNMIQLNHLDMSALEGYQFMQKNYYQLYTIASCVADVVKDASDQTPLRFPRISETDSEVDKAREIVSIPGLTKGQIINNVSGDNSEFRVDWVDLPINVFKTGIRGAVIVSSEDPEALSYKITICTLNAGWGSSAAMGSFPLVGSIFSRMSNVPSSWFMDKYFDDQYCMSSSPPEFGE